MMMKMMISTCHFSHNAVLSNGIQQCLEKQINSNSKPSASRTFPIQRSCKSMGHIQSRYVQLYIHSAVSTHYYRITVISKRYDYVFTVDSSNCRTTLEKKLCTFFINRTLELLNEFQTNEILGLHLLMAGWSRFHYRLYRLTHQTQLSQILIPYWSKPW